MRYRSTPIVIEAEQFRESQPLPFSARYGYGVCCFAEGRWFINSPNGPLYFRDGDFIIRRENGEFYPLDPVTFALTYEPVDPVTLQDRTPANRCPFSGTDRAVCTCDACGIRAGAPK